MNQYLDRIGKDITVISHPLNTEIHSVINADFLEMNDCITLKSLVNSNPEFSSDSQKCWWEYNENHFHPDWQVIESKDEIEYLNVAIVCAVSLAKRLKSTYPLKSFRILVSFYETDPNDPDSALGSSTVRFYQVRKDFTDEPGLRQLDRYQTDAILEITV